MKSHDNFQTRQMQLLKKYGSNPANYTPAVLKKLANGPIIDPNRYNRLLTKD